MLLLTSTSDKVQVVTGQAVTVDVHASYVDLNGSTVTPGRRNTAITTATTTDVVTSPDASTTRNVKTLSVRNKHATLPVTVTVQHTDGTTVIELDKRVVGPGQSVVVMQDGVFVSLPSGGSGVDPWNGQLVACANRGDPGLAMRQMQCAGNVAPTPTNISVSTARCSTFSLPFSMTVDAIRFYGVGATTNVYRVAIYRYSDLARLTAELAFTTVANAWGTAATGLGLALSANTLYFAAVAVNATGTTAGVGAWGGTVAAATGAVQTAPEALPGSLQLSQGFFAGYYFTFPVTSGALPDPAASLAAWGALTGGMPGFWLDAA